MVEIVGFMTRTNVFNDFIRDQIATSKYVDGRAPAPFLAKLDPFQSGTWRTVGRGRQRLPFFLNLD